MPATGTQPIRLDPLVLCSPFGACRYNGPPSPELRCQCRRTGCRPRADDCARVQALPPVTFLLPLPHCHCRSKWLIGVYINVNEGFCCCYCCWGGGCCVVDGTANRAAAITTKQVMLDSPSPLKERQTHMLHLFAFFLTCSFAYLLISFPGRYWCHCDFPGHCPASRHQSRLGILGGGNFFKRCWSSF